MDYLQREQQRINRAIKSALKSRRQNSAFFKAGEYALLSRGHRYRSMLGLGLYDILGGTSNNFLGSAVGIEFIHHASIIFDDLPCMDNSPLRKGKPAAHIKFGEAHSILAGLYLQEAGRQMIYENMRSHDGSEQFMDDVQRFIHESSVGLFKGQELDLKRDRTENELNELIFQKNRLFHFSAVLPAYLLRAPEHLQSLHEIGKSMAIAYQLLDDLRDITGSSETTGKPTHVDKSKNTSVYRYGVDYVIGWLSEEKERAIRSLRRIKENTLLENIIDKMLEERRTDFYI